MLGNILGWEKLQFLARSFYILFIFFHINEPFYEAKVKKKKNEGTLVYSASRQYHYTAVKGNLEKGQKRFNLVVELQKL